MPRCPTRRRCVGRASSSVPAADVDAVAFRDREDVAEFGGPCRSRRKPTVAAVELVRVAQARGTPASRARAEHPPTEGDLRGEADAVGNPAAAHRPGPRSTTRAGRRPGRSAPARRPSRRRRTPDLRVLRSGPRFRCTAVAPRRCGRRPEGHRCRRGSTLRPGSPIASTTYPRYVVTHGVGVPDRFRAAAASPAATCRQPAPPTANTTGYPHRRAHRAENDRACRRGSRRLNRPAIRAKPPANSSTHPATSHADGPGRPHPRSFPRTRNDHAGGPLHARRHAGQLPPPNPYGADEPTITIPGMD
jgi:hypothetical protein